jgi:hypothetical protein
MPYHVPADWPRFENLIAEVNRAHPAFTVHVGDIKSGHLPGDDAYFERIAGYFDRFDQPLIYTPGDNEWTDAHRPAAGGFDPLERLAALRRRFFAAEQSFGRNPLPLVSEKHLPGFEKYVENVRWEKGGVRFATVHVVGSNNNDQPAVPGAREEFRERDAADEAWMRAVFARAAAESSRAVVWFMQASPFPKDPKQAPGSGFTRFLHVLTEETEKFGRPVLLVHGDYHTFLLDKPLRHLANGRLLENFTRLEVFGEDDMHGVRVTVDPAGASLFSFQEFLVPGNLATSTASPAPVSSAPRDTR